MNSGYHYFFLDCGIAEVEYCSISNFAGAEDFMVHVGLIIDMHSTSYLFEHDI